MSEDVKSVTGAFTVYLLLTILVLAGVALGLALVVCFILATFAALLGSSKAKSVLSGLRDMLTDR